MNHCQLNFQDWDRSATQEEIEIMKADWDFDLRIPRNFQITVDIYDPKDHWKTRPVELLRNPQNTKFCEKMRLVDPFTVFKEGRDPTRPMEKEEETNVWNNPDDILIGMVETSSRFQIAGKSVETVGPANHSVDFLNEPLKR